MVVEKVVMAGGDEDGLGGGRRWRKGSGSSYGGELKVVVVMAASLSLWDRREEGGMACVYEYNFFLLSVCEKVCLRWVYEQGVSALVKSFNKERMRQNLEILGWTLSPEEFQKIDQIPQQKGCRGLEFDQIPQQKGCRGLEFVSDGGPYKSVEDLWDEPINLNVTGLLKLLGRRSIVFNLAPTLHLVTKYHFLQAIGDQRCDQNI
ncbi:hypothetical protein RHMOL_Rhmol01G0198200 [Rhododendron molle]|uniref:Uncharacterized protein n=1 Tax=Rhododendron molle TaxID=49168 RepID=A0ACC0Q388_RHOML|nr:hypothetical protein RHMOL_Rhmol01G0198200 [Rhododendron molle]